MSLVRRALIVGLALVTGACTTYGLVESKPLSRGEDHLALDDEQVDRLITTGRELLRNNAEFQRLLASLRSR